MIILLAIFMQINPVMRFYSISADTIKGNTVFLQSAFEKDTITWFYTKYGGVFNLGSDFQAKISVFFKHGNDSTYPTYNWHGIGSMDYKKALLIYMHREFRLSVGVDAPKLSQGYFTNLFFSGLEPCFPQVRFIYRHKGLEFNYLSGQMKESESYKLWPYPETKYFSFHSLAYSRGKFTGKFSEAVLFKSYNDNTVDWYLLMPFTIWYPRQANYHGTDLNIMWMLSLIWTPSEDKTIYGDFIIDDAPYKREKDENPRVGGLIGLRWESSGWTRIMEASFVTRYTYSYYPDRLYLSWFYNGFPLGSLSGTDFAKLSAFLGHSKGFYGYGEVLLHGEGEVGEPFNVGHLSHRVLLSGKAETNARLILGFRKYLFGTLVNLNLGFVKEKSISPSASLSVTKVWEL